MDKSKVKRVALQTSLLCILSMGFVLVAEVVGAVMVIAFGVSDTSLWASIIPEGMGALVALLGVALMGGGACVLTSHEDIRTILRLGWWNLLVTFGIMVIELGSYLLEGQLPAEGWLVSSLEVAFFCLLVGIFEEMVFRGFIFQGLLAVSGGTHRGVVRATLLTSLFFGLAHVDFDLAFVDALSFVQAVLKTVQTGMYSFLLCVIVLRSKRLGGVSLYHGFDDFLVMLPGVGLFGESLDIDYVSTGEDALPSIAFYLLIIALYLPFVISAARELQRGNYATYGLFAERRLNVTEGSVAMDATGVGLPPAQPTTLPQVPGQGPWQEAGASGAPAVMSALPQGATSEAFRGVPASAPVVVPQPLEGVVSAPVMMSGATHPTRELAPLSSSAPAEAAVVPQRFPAGTSYGAGRPPAPKGFERS